MSVSVPDFVPSAGDIVSFAGPERPIRVAGAAQALPFLEVFAALRPVSDPDKGACVPDLVVSEADGRFSVDGPALPPQAAPADGAVAAAHLLADRLTRLRALQPKGGLLAHGAGLLVEGRVVIALGDSGSGKSTLALHALARGIPILGDDRLALLRDTAGTLMATALGMRPKLRLPLPPDTAPEAAALAQSVLFETLDGVAIIDPPKPLLAQAGRAAPVAAIFELDRRPGTALDLIPLSASERVRLLLRHTAAARDRKADHLDRVLELTRGIPMLRLRYAHAAEAAARIAQALGTLGEAES